MNVSVNEILKEVFSQKAYRDWKEEDKYRSALVLAHFLKMDISSADFLLHEPAQFVQFVRASGIKKIKHEV